MKDFIFVVATTMRALVSGYRQGVESHVRQSSDSHMEIWLRIYYRAGGAALVQGPRLAVSGSSGHLAE